MNDGFQMRMALSFLEFAVLSILWHVCRSHMALWQRVEDNRARAKVMVGTRDRVVDQGMGLMFSKRTFHFPFLGMPGSSVAQPSQPASMRAVAARKDPLAGR